MLGAVCASELAVATPLSTSIGLFGSTPVNDAIPPAALVEAEKLQT
jgi:hypothetical protein